MNTRERLLGLEGKASLISSDNETSYFNMEKASVVWLEDRGSHSIHLMEVLTLHSSSRKLQKKKRQLPQMKEEAVQYSLRADEIISSRKRWRMLSL